MSFLVDMIDVSAPDTPNHALMHWADAHNHIMTGDPAILAATQRKKPNILQIQSDVITTVGLVPPAGEQINHGPDPVSRG
jgi:hypothetical protein